MQMNNASPLAPRSILSSLPQIRVLRVADLGFVDRGWARGHITCSFEEMPKEAPGYLDFGALKLAVTENMDAGAGYPMHPHSNSETIAVILSGAVAHQDTLSTETTIAGPNDVAVTCAGTGMAHSEMTHGDENARVVMFWLKCASVDAPRFERRTFDRASRRNRLVTFASGRVGACPTAIPMRSDASVSSAMLDADASISCIVAHGRSAYILATDGRIQVNGRLAESGDRVLVTGPHTVGIVAVQTTEVIILDLPKD